MPFTSDDLATIDRAIASGTLTVRFADGRSVTKRSADDLLRLRETIKGELAAAGGGPVVRRVLITAGHKGL